MAANPIQVGVVYTELDSGGDDHGDSFDLTFRGGAPGTQLRRVVISGDQNLPGFGVGDVFFDSAAGGLGADAHHPFTIESSAGIDRVRAYVEDGGTELILEFEGFDAGEVLRFAIDVDEVEQYDPNETNLRIVYEGFDPITSGVEFQGSSFTTEFTAPHFFKIEGTAEFRNRYDDALQASGLPLPADDFEGRRDRTAGAFQRLQQQHVPASLSGYVFHDRDNDGIRDAGEEGIANTRIRVVPVQTVISQPEVEIVTDANGFYTVTGLVAGEYRVVEVNQPSGYLDGKDSAGTVGSQRRGTAENDRITAIRLDGGDRGVEYNFGELLPVTIRGRVQLSTREGDCFTDSIHHDPVAGATVKLYGANQQLLAETVTDANGNYEFTGLFPGTYRLVEFTPAHLLNGGTRVGTVNGRAVGQILADGAIGGIVLASGQNGTRYDFCEHVPATLSGYVYHDREQDGRRDSNNEGIRGSIVRLLDENGREVARTTTDSVGFYEFKGLAAGRYALVQVQPVGWIDGVDTPGMILGSAVGRADNPGDQIEQIDILWGDLGTEYNFGEYLHGTLAGRVQLATREGDCFGDASQHPPIANAIVRLFDSAGNLLKETRTDADGRYQFTGLAPGRYRVVEITPEGLFDGGARAGTIQGRTVGRVIDPGTIDAIRLLSGESGLQYDFCEFPPAIIGGIVYHDRNDNGMREGGEEGIGSVLLELVGEQGDVIAQTRTNARGEYQFTGIRRGTYTIREHQPTGWFDGRDLAGQVNGVAVGIARNPGDQISEIAIGWGDTGRDYNFGEVLAGSIRGIVHTDIGIRNCIFEPQKGEILLAGVTIELLDADGGVVARGATDAAGVYRFDGLRPGTYHVRQTQPSGYFDGNSKIGSHGGDNRLPNEIRSIAIASGQDLVDYDFCEEPPVLISGHVFQDGEVLFLNPDEAVPERIRDVRDGRFTSDDTPLAGVWLELRDGITGDPISGDSMLPGIYGAGPIRVRTSATGFYQFTGLRAGTYAVFQVHPTGFVDGVDTPGTGGGVSFNPGEPKNEQALSTLNVNPRDDAIVRITAQPGTRALGNNFSEVKIERRNPEIPILPPQQPPMQPPDRPQALFPPLLARPQGPLLDQVRKPLPHVIGNASPTWHLSIINGGSPRGEGVLPDARTRIWLTAAGTRSNDLPPPPLELEGGHWELMTSYGHRAGVSTLRFGLKGAIPVSGDFDGDGQSQVGIYFRGHWFIDLNGNGEWDVDDLYARLGDARDQPVTGDWDGDGKTDIGIFGRRWSGDDRALAAETGEPDKQNRRRGREKNIPPRHDEATDGVRLLKYPRTPEYRADVIDHVFRFGRRGDIGVTGDWNGDGIHTIGVFRGGKWYLDVDGDGRWSEPDKVCLWGREGDQPVVGDFNGDGVTEIAIFRGGVFHIDRNGNGKLDGPQEILRLGREGDRAVAGDWNGDGTDEVAVYRGGKEVTMARLPKAS